MSSIVPPLETKEPVETKERVWTAPLDLHNDTLEWLFPRLAAHAGVVSCERTGWGGGIDLLVTTRADGLCHPLLVSAVGKQTNKPGMFKIQNTPTMRRQSSVRAVGAQTETKQDDGVLPLYHPEQVRFAVDGERAVFMVARLKNMGNQGEPFTTALSFTIDRKNASTKPLWYKQPDRVFIDEKTALDTLVNELVGSRVMQQHETPMTIQPSLRQESMQYMRLVAACQGLGLSCEREPKQDTTVDVWINRHSVQMKVVGRADDGYIKVRVDKRAGFNKGPDNKNSTPICVPYADTDFEALIVECEQLPGRFCVLPMAVLRKERKVSSLGVKGVVSFRILVPNGAGRTDWATPYWDGLVRLKGRVINAAKQ